MQESELSRSWIGCFSQKRDTSVKKRLIVKSSSLLTVSRDTGRCLGVELWKEKSKPSQQWCGHKTSAEQKLQPVAAGNPANWLCSAGTLHVRGWSPQRQGSPGEYSEGDSERAAPPSVSHLWVPQMCLPTELT